MTEEEWLNATDWNEPLLDVLSGRKFEIDAFESKEVFRKYRLFACATCRTIDNMLTLDDRRALEISEMFADGLVEKSALAEVWLARGRNGADPKFNASEAVADALTPPGFVSGHCIAVNTAGGVLGAVFSRHKRQWTKALERKYASSCKEIVHLLRDIFGNPFRPVTFDPEWRTSTVAALANQMYESRDFSIMPILADAL